MNSNENVVERLIEIQKQNQGLLKIIAESQTLMLELEKEKKVLEKRKMWFGVGKYVFWIIMIWLSFIFTQRLTTDLLNGGLAGDVKNSASSLTENVNNLLRGGMDADLQSEFDRYLGN